MSNIVKCKICGKDLSSPQAIKNHIRWHKLSTKNYYDTYINTTFHKCQNCNNEAEFISIFKGYSNKCKKCALKRVKQTKIICKICGQELTSRGSSHFIKTHKITSKEYYDKYLKKENEDICPICQMPTTFRDISYGYNKTCSKECHKLYCKSDQFKQKQEIGVKKHFGEDGLRCKEVRNKTIQTNLKKYGVDNSAKSVIVKEKVKQTCLNKYGTEAFTQTNLFKEKRKETCLEKYGVPFSQSSEISKEKLKQTMLDHYGVDNPWKADAVRQKIKDNCFAKYGVDNPQQRIEVKEKAAETREQNNFLDQELNNPDE